MMFGPAVRLTLGITLAFHTGCSFAKPTLKDAITDVMLPVLQNWSIKFNESAWSFAYRDAEFSFTICTGYSDIVAKTPCSASDRFNFGSTTKTQTALMILKLWEAGQLDLEDPIVPHVDPYIARVWGNTTSLELLFGPQIHNVTIRHLLQHSSGIVDYDDPNTAAYQNEYRLQDLDPIYILQNMDHTFTGFPGTPPAMVYSSTGYVILGLVLANHMGASNWDKLDQKSWIPKSRRSSGLFDNIDYPVHGPCSNFSTADGSTNSSIHGYQLKHVRPDQRDVYNMSCTQGWTCGNLNAPVGDVANFFWTLLGPPSQNPNQALIMPSTLQKMLSFQTGQYFGPRHSAFGYGMGMMDFTSMKWGFQFDGKMYGHNGLTYGFAAQSGYNYDLNFAASWVSNVQHWIGPDYEKSLTVNSLYGPLVKVVQDYRSRSSSDIFI